MKVLVVGGGGREHGICWKLSQSPLVDHIYCAPGNGGIRQVAECVSIGAEDIHGLVDFAKERVDFCVVGPEVPLAMGLVDEMQKVGVRTFGPNKKCSQLEASKAFTKEFLQRHRIPTAKYKEYEEEKKLREDIGIFGYPMVMKADGLAAGKGVMIAKDRQEAGSFVTQLMGDKVLGSAADKVVVEECLVGIEASVLCFVDHHTIKPMASAQDYKRIFTGDLGPNTGGMGTYSPSKIFTERLEERIKNEILTPTLKGFQEDGLDFQGVLFIGLMITGDGPKVIEFNNRFGDPETQSVLPRMENDLMEVFLAVEENRLSDIELKWRKEQSLCLILASEGYPGSYEKGKPITGVENLPEEIMVFHSGTKWDEGKQELLTAGGRVLGIVAFGKTVEEARTIVYKNGRKVHFEGKKYREDIGIIGTEI